MNMNNTHKVVVAAVTALSIATSTVPATAQDYPNAPVRLIVPYAAGGGTDLSARLLQEPLGDALGTSVVVENRAGGAGWVGWAALAAAEPDGYTIGYINLPNLIVGYLNPDAGRTETWEDFDFLTNHVVDAGVIAIRANDERFSDLESLIEYAKENPTSSTSSGVGSATHFAGLQMNARLDTNFEFVHSGGTGDSIPAVLGGHVDVLIAGIADAVSSFDSGELRPIAVFGPERVSLLPDVPTVTEVTDVEFDRLLRRAIAMPNGVPEDVRAELVEALIAAQTTPEHIENLEQVGLQADHLSGDELDQMVANSEAEIIELLPELGWR